MTHVLIKVLAMLKIHGFNKKAAIFNDRNHMSLANNRPYTKGWSVDIQAVVGREGCQTYKADDRIIKDKVWHVNP